MQMTAKTNYGIEILMNISASETWKSKHWYKRELFFYETYIELAHI